MGAPSYAETVERLESEIRSAHASVNSAITNRRNHPSFGYTKTMIREEFSRLHGLVEAHFIVSGGWQGSASPIRGAIREHGESEFGFDLYRLSEKVADC